MTDYCDEHGHTWPEIFRKHPEHREKRRCLVCEHTLIFMPAHLMPGLWVDLDAPEGSKWNPFMLEDLSDEIPKPGK